MSQKWVQGGTCAKLRSIRLAMPNFGPTQAQEDKASEPIFELPPLDPVLCTSIQTQLIPKQPLEIQPGSSKRYPTLTAVPAPAVQFTAGTMITVIFETPSGPKKYGVHHFHTKILDISRDTKQACRNRHSSFSKYSRGHLSRAKCPHHELKLS